LSTAISLNGNWQLEWKSIEGSIGVPECKGPILGRVPGDVHQDLVDSGLLPEPLIGLNVREHEWVEQALFTYKRTFAIEADFDRAELVLDGADCFAEVFVDGQFVGASANAFVPHKFDITGYVRLGTSHEIEITVESGVQWAKQRDVGELIVHENPERVFLRKPQFAFGWDWAPRLVTCGLWRGASIRLYKSAAIRDVSYVCEFECSGVTLKAKAEIDAFAKGDYAVNLRAKRGPKVLEAESVASLVEGTNHVELSLVIDPVERWFPVGYGDQALYELEFEVSREGQSVDIACTNYGFREIKVEQEPLAQGETSFIINVNGIDVFCKGANWVPADSIVARVTAEKYESLVKEAVAANFNMFRVWGGGIYEDEVFYDLCDKHGILIWQDFMFACAEYPETEKWFVENVEDEVGKAVKLLRDHPCIALWCGNNENDWMFGYYERGKDGKMQPFYGQKIYHEVIPTICAQLDPSRFYWPSSPYGGDDPNCEQHGDRHCWNVSILHKDPLFKADIRNYRLERGKFNSEYGVLSLALPRTVLDYTGRAELDYSTDVYRFHDNPNNYNSGMVEQHMKLAFGGVPDDPTQFAYQSMAYQAIGYREAISQFRIHKFDCAGSLFWMYSDCWGTIGWTILDYYLRRKPSYYWVRRAYAPVAVFVRVEDGVVRTYVVNDTLATLSGRLTLEVGDMSGRGKNTCAEVAIPANGVVSGPELTCEPGYAFARFQPEGGVSVDDCILTHFPSELDVPPVTILAEKRQIGEEIEVAISVDGFAHFVRLELPDGAVPTDNYFNVIPNRPKIVRVRGAKISDIYVTALNARP